MQETRVWRALLGLQNTVVEGVDFDDDASVVVVHVRPVASRRGRCGSCRRRSPGFDHGDGRRRWRALDLGTVQAFIEADAPRVRCRRHGVIVASVPWARHDAGHTRDFDDTVAWLATITSKTAVTRLMRVAWRTVGSIVARVWADTGGAVDRLEGLARIGIDEISYRRGQQYLTVVVDHDSGRLVWAAPGNSAATLRAFFDALGPARSAAITHVSADGAEWIAVVVAERIPDAVLCADAFRVVAWATARSGSSPASPSASRTSTPSSPWPCSASAATAQPYPVETDPRMRQEIPRKGRFRQWRRHRQLGHCGWSGHRDGAHAQPDVSWVRGSHHPCRVEQPVGGHW
jgi:transposase